MLLLYQILVLLVHIGDPHSASFLIQRCKLKEVCDGWSDRGAGYDTGAALRRLARRCSDADQVRRVTLQIVRDWVLRFNAEVPDGLISRKRKSIDRD